MVPDFFARRAVSDRLHQELALEALRKALTIRRPRKGLMHHSNRGSQYCATAYQAELKKHGIRISMFGKGNCYDNAVVETFFKTLKSELVWLTVFQTRAEAKAAIGRDIDGFYNSVRHHLTLDYVSPVQFERLAQSTAKRSRLNRSKSIRSLRESQIDFTQALCERTGLAVGYLDAVNGYDRQHKTRCTGNESLLSGHCLIH